MKITKYHQSCLLVESKETRILVDPGNISYTDTMCSQEWTDIDCILVTHKHPDHCLEEAINTIVMRDQAKLYTSYETIDAHTLYGAEIVKVGDIITLEGITIGVVKAVHGYLPKMKQGAEVKENLGYIISDGTTRLYITSDTICFNQASQCDVIAMPFNGNGLTMGSYEGPLFAKETGAKLVLPIHLEHPDPIMMPDLEKIQQNITAQGMQCRILTIGEQIEV